jgi:hypothetical protein
MYLKWKRFTFITKPFTSRNIILFKRRITAKEKFQ